jgi:ribosomal subunit interface protein
MDMTIQVTGKNIDAGEAFQSYVVEKVNSVLEKYIGPEIAGHVRLEKERGRFHTDCSIKLRTGLTLEARGEAGDAYASADAAVEHLEKRVRRYKRRLKSHHNGAEKGHGPQTPAAYYILQVDEEEPEEAKGDNPVIIAETERLIRQMPVAEAVMQLDLIQAGFFVFRNASHGGINIVYQRPDGNIGWIDPKPKDAP